MARNSPYKLLPQVAMYTQSEMKDTKDLSKNLVSGDFERDYREDVMKKSPGKCLCFAVLAVLVAGLGAWLLGLTIVREIQLTRLRQEIDDLTADMITMKATLRSMNKKLSSDTNLFNEVKMFEDAIYADIDHNDDTEMDETKKKENATDSLEKLDGLTVLEDEEDINDDSMYDEDDVESGDWYTELTERRPKTVGKNTMVKLKPDDFMGEVVTLQAEDKPFSKIRELKRMLNEDPQNPGVFAAIKSDLVELQDEASHRSKRSVFPDSPVDAVDSFAAPRSIAKSDDRRKMKKYNLVLKMPDMVKSAPRTARNSDDEEGRPRAFIAAHFHGNTSHLNPEIHEHYKGNGLIRVAHDAPHDVWYPSQWTSSSPHPRPTLTKRGHVHVHHTGVYLVYAQIYYLDAHDVTGWVLHRTNLDINEREPLIQCVTTSASNEPRDKPNSCFSASAVLLRAGDRLAIRNIGGDRHSLMQPEKSFIGLVKLADANVPEDEL